MKVLLKISCSLVLDPVLVPEIALLILNSRNFLHKHSFMHMWHTVKKILCICKVAFKIAQKDGLVCFLLYFNVRKKTGKLRWFFFCIWKYSVIDQIFNGTFITVLYRSEPVLTKHHRLIATLPKFRVSTAPKLVERTLTESPWLMRQWRCEAKGDNYVRELPQHAKRNSEKAAFLLFLCFCTKLGIKIWRKGPVCGCRCTLSAHLSYPARQQPYPNYPFACHGWAARGGGRRSEEWGLPTSDVHRERPDMHSVSLLMCRDPRHDRN